MSALRIGLLRPSCRMCMLQHICTFQHYLGAHCYRYAQQLWGMPPGNVLRWPPKGALARRWRCERQDVNARCVVDAPSAVGDCDDLAAIEGQQLCRPAAHIAKALGRPARSQRVRAQHRLEERCAFNVLEITGLAACKRSQMSMRSYSGGHSLASLAVAACIQRGQLARQLQDLPE